MLSTYAALAAEYYDPKLHPTCANFREASHQILASWLSAPHRNGRWLEVGAGRSLVAEISGDLRGKTSQLVLLDSSRDMIEYSRHWFWNTATPVLGDAEKLPFTSESCSMIVSVLGDPYNTPAFWEEAHRVLETNGEVAFTVPAYEWSQAFRGDQASAEFKLRDGTRTLVPSFIYPPEVQGAMIESVGLMVRSTGHVGIEDLPSNTLSPRICKERGPSGRVVDAFRVRKGN